MEKLTPERLRQIKEWTPAPITEELLSHIAALDEDLKNSREWADSQNKSAQGWNAAWKDIVQERDQLRVALQKAREALVKLKICFNEDSYISNTCNKALEELNNVFGE